MPSLNPFTPAALSDIQKIANTNAEILRIVKATGQTMQTGYAKLMQLVYANSQGLTPQQAVSRLTDEQKVELRQMAIRVKTIINATEPGLIDDFVPEATLTMPANLFPEIPADPE